jgi:hypothetical protein
MLEVDCDNGAIVVVIPSSVVMDLFALVTGIEANEATLLRTGTVLEDKRIPPGNPSHRNSKPTRYKFG